MVLLIDFGSPNHYSALQDGKWIIIFVIVLFKLVVDFIDEVVDGIKLLV